MYRQAIYNDDNSIKIEGISDFVVMDRESAGSWDERIMKKGWYKILLWKYNNQWIMIKDSRYKPDSNSNQSIYSTPDLFTSKFSNIYIKNKNDVILNNVSIYKQNVYKYIQEYDLDITKKFDINVNYNIGDYNNKIDHSLANLNLTEDENKLVNYYTRFIDTEGNIIKNTVN